jgi:hypothetical protein
MAKKVGRPKVAANEKKVALTIMVKARHRKELQELFKKESLDKLKDINLLTDYGQEIATGFGLVEQGDDEGREGDTEPQDEDD